MRLIRRFNWVHIGVISILPIILAFINSNWIFNLSMADDYIYLGYQLDFSKYIGWHPSDSSYFIERLIVIIPSAIIRQIFSPVVANFILHLGVYYLAIYSVYGILNKLFNARIAIFIAILFGQYPLIMRATGWDYPDGYALAFFSVAILCLTYSIQSRWRPLYLIGAGASFLLMINAHFFNLFYAPALAIYLLFLERDLYKKPIHLFKTGIYVFIGIIAVYIPQALFYYQMTGNLLFSNSIGTAQTSTQALYYFLLNNYSQITANWHLFLVGIAVMAIWQLMTITKMPTLPPLTSHLSTRHIMKTVVALFITSYAVIIGWRLLGFLYINVSFYHANIIMSAFLVLGGILSYIIMQLSSRQFFLVGIMAFFAPILAFTITHQFVAQFTFGVYWALFWVTILFIVLVILVKNTQIRLYTVILLMISLSVFIGNSHHIRIYNSNPHYNRMKYETTVKIATAINQRYENVSLDNFRFWYTFNDPKSPIIESVISIYLWGWDRYAVDRQFSTTFFDTKEIIILTSLDTDSSINFYKSSLVSSIQANSLDEMVIDDIHLIFTDISLISRDTFNYFFSSQELGIIIDESGWNGYEATATQFYRWTAEPQARLVFNIQEVIFDTQSKYQICLNVMTSLEQDVVESFRLFVNDVSIDLIREGNWFIGTIDGTFLSGDTMELRFETDRVSNPFDLGIQDGRKLGVALSELTIAPLGDDE